MNMILTGTEIKKRVGTGEITLDPFHDDLLNPNSYNYRLGDKLLVFKNEVIDTKIVEETSEITIPTSGLTLQPGSVYLGSTFERIGSINFVPSLIGRSSLGRLGLFLQITADLGHLGTSHKWTLELTCVQPLIVYPRMKIGQVSFWKPLGRELLKSKYTDKSQNYSEFSKPHVSMPNKFN